LPNFFLNLLNNRLDWSPQINNAKAKAYSVSVLGKLKRTFKYWTPYSFKVLFATYVRPHLEFCATAWNPYNEKDIGEIESVQRTATKIIPSLRSLHYDDRLKSLNLQRLEHRRKRGDLIQFFKINQNLNKVSWTKPILPASSVISHGPASSIRGNEHRLARETIKNCLPREHFFKNRVIKAWNELPNNIIKSSSVNNFKKELDSFTSKHKYFYFEN